MLDPDPLVEALTTAFEAHYPVSFAQSIVRCACGVTLSGGIDRHLAEVAVAVFDGGFDEP